MLEVKFKKLDDRAVIPFKANPGDAGLDLVSIEEKVIFSGQYALVKTGLVVELPQGHEGEVRPRSGLALKHGVTVLNSPGTIDEGYRGEIGVILINHGDKPYTINVGDKIAQLVIAPVPKVKVLEVKELSDSVRGQGGFGSSGVSVNDAVQVFQKSQNKSTAYILSWVENLGDRVVNFEKKILHSQVSLGPKDYETIAKIIDEEIQNYNKQTGVNR